MGKLKNTMSHEKYPQCGRKERIWIVKKEKIIYHGMNILWQ